MRLSSSLVDLKCVALAWPTFLLKRLGWPESQTCKMVYCTLELPAYNKATL